MDQKTQSDITPEELEKRLDEIFGGGEKQEASSDEQSLLSDLESSVLTLDWEISEDTVHSFLSEVDSLRSSQSVDKLQGNFLKILHSLGKYVQRRKSRADPEAVNLLQTVFADLKKTVESGDLSHREKKEMLLRDIEQYNALKSKIAKRRSHGEEDAGVQETAAAPQEQRERGAADAEGTVRQEAGRFPESRPEEGAAEPGTPLTREFSGEKSVLQAVEELKGVVREEFRKLRQDLGVGTRD